MQLTYLFPRTAFHLIFIGPESMANRDNEFPLPERTPTNPFGAVVEDRLSASLKISTFVEYYQTLHKAGHFHPYDPYFDCFMLFHPGLGHPASSHEWADTIPQLLETKVPIFVTGYTKYDMERDIEWVKKTVGGEMDLLMEPGENRFRSLRWDLNDYDPQDISCGNWGVWAFRGKRYVHQLTNIPKLQGTRINNLLDTRLLRRRTQSRIPYISELARPQLFYIGVSVGDVYRTVKESYVQYIFIVLLLDKLCEERMTLLHISPLVLQRRFIKSYFCRWSCFL